MPETKVFTTSPVATGTNTETVILSSDVVGYNNPAGEGIIVRGMVNITTGTGTTAVVTRLRKGIGVGGATVGTALTDTIAAGSSRTIFFAVLDAAPTVTPAGSAGSNQYTVTVQQTGGSAAGQVNVASLNLSTATTGW